MAFRWRAYDGPFIAVFGSFIPSSTKKNKKTLTYQVWTPSDKTFWIFACNFLVPSFLTKADLYPVSYVTQLINKELLPLT